MTSPRQVTAATETLLQRRSTLTRSRLDNEADAVELGAERRPEDQAENDEISDVLMRLSERETQELHEVDAALDRLAKGTWGRCEQCQAEIAARRMDALPQARTCSNCMSDAPTGAGSLGVRSA
jgi:RNA polymerase-binding transcription factor DksA